MREGQRPWNHFGRPVRQVVGDRLRHRLRPAGGLRLVLQVDCHLSVTIRPKGDFFRRPRYYFVLGRVWIRHVRGNRVPGLPCEFTSLNDVAVGVIVHVFDWRGVRVGRVVNIDLTVFARWRHYLLGHVLIGRVAGESWDSICCERGGPIGLPIRIAYYLPGCFINRGRPGEVHRLVDLRNLTIWLVHQNHPLDRLIEVR